MSRLTDLRVTLRRTPLAIYRAVLTTMTYDADHHLEMSLSGALCLTRLP